MSVGTRGGKRAVLALFVGAFLPGAASAAPTVRPAIPVGTLPAAISVNSNTGRVYVLNQTSNSVSVIDEASNAVIATVALASSPSDIGIDRTTDRIYVSSKVGNAVFVIDGATNSVVATIAVGTGPGSVSVNDQTGRVYVANETSNDVSVIAEATNTVIATIPVGAFPSHMAVDRVKNRVYTSNRTDNTVSLIDGAANTVVATIVVGSSPRQVAVNDQTSRVYVANKVSNTVSVIDGVTATVASTLAVGTAPSRVAVNRTTNKIYILNETSASISVIDGTRDSVAATVAVGTTPLRLVVEPTTNLIYAVNNGSNNVSVIDGNTNAVAWTLAVGTSPKNIAVDSVRERVFVSNQADNTVSVIDEDAVPPDTFITSGPASFTNATSAQFAFRGTDDLSSASALRFRCSFDGAAASLCTSPVTYSGLAAGSHRFSVAAMDQAGNIDPSPAASTWTVDVIPPDTTLTASPTSLTSSTSATFSFIGSDNVTSASAMRFLCRLDGGVRSPCSSPFTYNGLSSTSHTVEIAATDQAGNIDSTPASFTWTIDAIPPNTTIATTDATDPSNQRAVTFTFQGTDNRTPSGTLRFQCKIDSGTFAVCISPVSYSLGSGAHTFQVRAVDEANNTDPTPASFSWTIDLLAPSSTFLTPSGSALLGLGLFNGVVVGRTTDDLSGVKGVVVSFERAGAPTVSVAASLSCDTPRLVCDWSASAPSAPGRYTVRAQGTDRARNGESPGRTIDVTII